MVREHQREDGAIRLVRLARGACHGRMEVANFVVAMLILGLLAFAIHDTLARSLARDDELERRPLERRPLERRRSGGR